MGFYALVGLEGDRNIRDVTKRAVAGDIGRRRDFVKTSGDKLTCNGRDGENSQLFTVQPDYMLAYAIAVLAHLPRYKDQGSISEKRIQGIYLRIFTARNHIGSIIIQGYCHDRKQRSIPTFSL